MSEKTGPAANAIPPVCVVLDGVRSLYNVGAVMRACDGAGVTQVHACGITPYPPPADLRDDPRRGPVAARAERELRKTALGAYDSVAVTPWPDVKSACDTLRDRGYTLVAIERTPDALPMWDAPILSARPLALILGHEVDGIAPSVLSQCDATVSIPMHGSGHSLNVAIACAVVLYEVARRERG